MLTAFTAFYQEHLPYSYEGVESNDTLYMGGDIYKSGLLDMGNSLLDQVLKEINALADEDSSTNRKQASGKRDLIAFLTHFSERNTKVNQLIQTLSQ